MAAIMQSLWFLCRIFFRFRFFNQLQMGLLTDPLPNFFQCAICGIEPTSGVPSTLFPLGIKDAPSITHLLIFNVHITGVLRQLHFPPVRFAFFFTVLFAGQLR